MRKIKNLSILLVMLILLSTLIPSIAFAETQILPNATGEEIQKDLEEKDKDHNILENEKPENKEDTIPKKREYLKSNTKDKEETEDIENLSDREIQKKYEQALIDKHNLQIEFNKVLKEQEIAKRELQGFKNSINTTSAKKVPVLLYHHILPKEDIIKYGWQDNSGVISLEDFKAQMKYLKDNNYFTATADEVALYAKGEMRLPEKTVAITFDDGYLSNAKHAYPVLKENNMKATIFIIGDTNEREKEEYDPSDLQRIHLPDLDLYKDVFKYESHTYGLHDFIDNLTGLQTASRDEILRDTGKFRQLIPSFTLAYPGGRYNDNIIESIKTAGYTSAFTTQAGYVQKGSNLYKLPRFIISSHVPFQQFQNIVNGVSK